MDSLKTNFAAMTALQALQQTNKELVKSQERISTGYRVSSAEDNAAYWSISTTMRSDNKALSTVADALGLGSATVDVAYTALNSAIDVVTDIKAKLVAAREPGVDKSRIQDQLTEMQRQLKSIAGSAVFSGQNWLSVDSSASGYNATKSIVSSFSRDATGAIDIGMITFAVDDAKLFDASASSDGILDGKRDATGALSATGTYSISSIDISALTDSASDTATLESYIKGADAAISDMTKAGSSLGSTKQRIGLQQTFVGVLKDAIDRGIATLVDADMNEESTRLQALQTQQQLGIQALSITNSSAQNILSLFRNG